jgi:peptidoglycan/LPS O-acetylase OafA/YrhL
MFKQILFDHFRELLLCVMALIFGGMAVWMLKHGAPDDGFKWASGAAGTLLGALLMLMRGQDTTGPRPTVPAPPSNVVPGAKE